MSIGLFVFNALNQLVPYRGFFGLRRLWLRRCGLRVAGDARIAATARFYGSEIHIGRKSWIGPETTIFSAEGATVIIGERVDLGPGCMIVSGTHDIGHIARRAGHGHNLGIEIGEGTWICARAVILGGARIGQACVVAAGAVVTGECYPSNVLLGGVPARVIRELSPLEIESDVVACHHA